MSALKSQIQSLASAYFEEIRGYRRYIHAHPELSFEEEKTAAFVAGKLDEAGIPYKNKIAGNGIVAEIKGIDPESKMVALRADLDALPIQEKNKKEYASQNDGIMHACGHDVHTSSLLGAGKILNELKGQFKGTVRLIFQPAEEKLPGGASLMIKEGVLRNPVPIAIIGQHVLTELPVGKVGFRPGLFMASTDELYIAVKGKGGHAANPHQLIDPVFMAAQMIVTLQQVVSRWNKPSMPTVLSFGKIIGMGATNVIPDEVKIEGTFRTFDEEWRASAHKRMKKLAENLIEGMGGEVDFEIRKGYPFLKNDVALTEKLSGDAAEYMGVKNVVELDIRTTAEDFAYYTHEIPGCFYRLGTGNEALGITYPIHTPYFDIDEDALKTGMGLMAYLAVRALEE